MRDQAADDGAPRAIARIEGRPRTAYRACLVSWHRGEATGTDIDLITDTARRWDSRSKLVSINSGTQLLLLAEASPQAETRRQLRAALLEVVEAVKHKRPQAEIHTVIGDRVRPGQRLAAVISRLRHIERCAVGRGSDPVVSARRYSLLWLLEGLETRRAAAFIEEQLDSLAAYDREHGTDLLRVLELGLDHHSRSTAAGAAFMHRNTFRRQLRRALDLIDADIDSPEERLALHLALKMRRAGGPPSARSQPPAG